MRFSGSRASIRWNLAGRLASGSYSATSADANQTSAAFARVGFREVFLRGFVLVLAKRTSSFADFVDEECPAARYFTRRAGNVQAFG
jgi:hypothetical protein